MRNAKKTRSSILEAAKDLFTKRGFEGTSLAMIERQSGVSRGLILHHFRTKKNLYAAVKEAMITDYVSMLSRVKEDPSLRASIVKTTIVRSLEYLEADPSFYRMQLWEYLEGADRFSDPIASFTEGFIAVVGRVQHEGGMRKDIPDYIAPLIIRGALEYWVRNGRLIASLAGRRNIPFAAIRGSFIESLRACLSETGRDPGDGGGSAV